MNGLSNKSTRHKRIRTTFKYTDDSIYNSEGKYTEISRHFRGADKESYRQSGERTVKRGTRDHRESEINLIHELNNLVTESHKLYPIQIHSTLNAFVVRLPTGGIVSWGNYGGEPVNSGFLGRSSGSHH